MLQQLKIEEKAHKLLDLNFLVAVCLLISLPLACMLAGSADPLEG
jgi:hypothetical protein